MTEPPKTTASMAAHPTTERVIELSPEAQRALTGALATPPEITPSMSRAIAAARRLLNRDGGQAPDPIDLKPR